MSVMPDNTSGISALEDPVPDCSVVILAGGLSRRFGRDKANALWQGIRMIGHVAGRARVLGCELIAVCRAGQDTAGWDVDRIVYDDPALPDGPLRGLVRGLEDCRTPWAFATSCDTPLLHPGLLAGLRRAATPQCLAVAPHWSGRLQPMPALYKACGAKALRTMLKQGEQSPTNALKQLPFVLLPEEACRAFDPQGDSFLNVNYPQDLPGPEFAGRSLTNPGRGVYHVIR